jgi:HAE1 family hydrophobic/amphiphilic exporter-1
MNTKYRDSISKNLSPQEERNFFVGLASFFVDKWRLTIIFIITIIIVGVFGLNNNQRQDFPPISVNVILVRAVYPGASSSNVEKDVVVPIEQQIKSIKAIENINSSASDNFGTLQLETNLFKKDQLAEKSVEISEEIAKLNLPTGVETEVQTIDASGESMVLALVNKDRQKGELIQEAINIKNFLETSSKDIQKIEISPSSKFEINIELDSDKLEENNLSFDTVKSIVQANLLALPGGSVQEADGIQKSIQIQTLTNNLVDLEFIQIGPVQLKDLATITRKPSNLDTLTYAGYLVDKDKDGKGEHPEFQDSVYLTVYKTEQGDTINISNKVKQELNKIKEKRLTSLGTTIFILYDGAQSVDKQIKDLLSSSILGILLILVVLLFFINFRASVVVASIIPIVFLITFFVLYLVGFTINILTLFGMILALGILVDNAIVIVEGIVSELEKGATRRIATLRAVGKLGSPVTSATLTTLVVFLPFASFPGVIGEFLKFIPYTVIIMMLVSYCLALTITPVFGRFLIEEEAENKQMPIWQKLLILPLIISYIQKLVNLILKLYKTIIVFLLNSVATQIIVIILAFIAMAGGLYTAQFLEGGSFPEVDTNAMLVAFDFPVDTKQATREEATKAVLTKAIDLEYFESAYVQGNSLILFFTRPTDRVDSDTTIFDLVKDLNDKIEKDVRPNFEDIDIQAKTVQSGPPTGGYDITLSIKNNNLKTLENSAKEITDFIRLQEGVDKVLNGFEANLVPSITVELDKDQLKKRGLNRFLVSQSINQIFSSSEIGSLSLGESEVLDKLFLTFDAETKNSVDKLKNITIPSPVPAQSQVQKPSESDQQSSTPKAPTKIKLSEIADIQEVQKLTSIKRKNGDRYVEISVKLKEFVKVADFQTKIEEFLGLERDDQNKLVVGDQRKLELLGIESIDKISFGGSQADTNEDLVSLLLIGVLALIGVYIVLVNQFNSYIKPGLIMFTIVIALGGVFPALYAFKEGLNLISGLGIVALIGVAVNDAIVFIDNLGRLQKENTNKTERANILAKASYTRFKPILSTTMTTVLGILPLAIGDPFWRGLGICIVAGLTFSTIGTLIIIPIVYNLSASCWGFLFGRKSKKLDLGTNLRTNLRTNFKPLYPASIQNHDPNTQPKPSVERDTTQLNTQFEKPTIPIKEAIDSASLKYQSKYQNLETTKPGDGYLSGEAQFDYYPSPSKVSNQAKEPESLDHPYQNLTDSFQEQPNPDIDYTAPSGFKNFSKNNHQEINNSNSSIFINQSSDQDNNQNNGQNSNQNPSQVNQQASITDLFKNNLKNDLNNSQPPSDQNQDLSAPKNSFYFPWRK